MSKSSAILTSKPYLTSPSCWFLLFSYVDTSTCLRASPRPCRQPKKHKKSFVGHTNLSSNLNGFLPFLLFSFFTRYQAWCHWQGTSIAMMTALSGGFRVLISIRLHAKHRRLVRAANSICFAWQMSSNKKKNGKKKTECFLSGCLLLAAHIRRVRRINSFCRLRCNPCYALRCAQLIRAGVYVTYT